MSLQNPFRLTGQRVVQSGLITAALLASAPGFAIDFGPDGMFTLTGFAKVESSLGSNHCDNCARFPSEDRQRFWADELVPGREYKTTGSTVTLFQPWLAAKQNLGNGFTVTGLLSQRWRDGMLDMAFDPNIWYEKNIALSHEDYGRIAVGSMTSRGWAVADYPYGTNIGLSQEWGSSGAGYGMLGNSVRVTTRPLDVLEGDLVLEATYDQGNTNFKINKPWFAELYAQYHRGDFVLDAVYQDSRNGKPMAWAHGPFSGQTDSAEYDAKLSTAGQSIAMVMARYQLTSQIEVSGGIRANRWSGANAVLLDSNGKSDLWNNMFNVWWDQDQKVPTAFAATSTDLMAGVRYRTGPWTASTGLVYLGKASTSNPKERGQSNDATVGTVGLNYDYGQGIQFYAFAGLVHFGRLGLAPLSIPGNNAFWNVDSRVTQDGNWFGLGAVYTF
jgi:hypothetical protein